ncbi:BsaWI family type II restriction enzyme [Helicobacter sp. 23-1048]
MTITDLINLYENKKAKFGNETYKYLSQIFKEAKEIHRDFALQKGINDTEQSWRAFKGKNLEKLIEYIIADSVRNLGLEIINGNKLETTKNLPKNLEMIKRNLCVDYGEFGMHLPDVDMVVFEPKSCKIIAVLSSKVTLRERIAQTGYWKLKLLESSMTRHIKVFFITLDEDETLRVKSPAKKGRAICEVDTDGCYILSSADFEPSKKIKLFAEFISDLKKIL